MSKFHEDEASMQEQDEGARIATEIAIKNQKADFDEQVNKLAEAAVEYTVKYGENNFNTEMMVMFLEMALAMQKAMEDLTMSQVAITTIQKAMGVVQKSLKFNDEVMTSLLSEDMGVFARFRRKRKMRAAIRNMRSSIVTTFNEVMGFSKLAQDISEDLQDIMEKMQRSTRKAKRRRQKRQERAEKRKRDNDVPLGPSPAKKLIEETMERMRKEGKLGDIAADASGSTGGNSGGAGSSNTSSDKGIDDIL